MKIEVDLQELELFIRSQPAFRSLDNEEFRATCSLLATLELAKTQQDDKANAEIAAKYGPPLIITKEWAAPLSEDQMEELAGFSSPVVVGVEVVNTLGLEPHLLSSALISGGPVSDDFMGRLSKTEKVQFKFLYTSTSRVATVKALRQLTDWSLKQAVPFVAALPDGHDTGTTAWLAVPGKHLYERLSSHSLFWGEMIDSYHVACYVRGNAEGTLDTVVEW